MSYEIISAPSPNYYKGRKGYKPIAIVNHITAGYMPGTLKWLQNPESKVSCNYLVTRDGKIYCLVDPANSAWCNGGVHKPSWKLLITGVNPNYYTISIEHEGMPGLAFTDVQIEASIWLHNKLVNEYNIPIDEDHIIGHYMIDSVNKSGCPGKLFPWSLIFKRLKEMNEIAVIEKPILKGVVTASVLNIRNGPGTNYTDIGDLTKGANVDIYLEKGGWYRISSTENKWISGGYVNVSPIEPEVSTPVISIPEHTDSDGYTPGARIEGLAQWMIDLGRQNVQYLKDKGIISSTDHTADVDEYAPAWLVFTLAGGIVKYIDERLKER